MSRILIILIFLTSLILYSCRNKQNQELKSIVKEWHGKEILFPDKLVFTRYGQDSIPFPFSDSEYKIVLYVDSTGCTSCKLRIYEWKKLIYELDSITDRHIPVLFFFSPKDKAELSALLNREKFDYPVIFDTDDMLNKINKLPKNHEFQCFLLDKNNRVAYIGNPIDKIKVKESYLSLITGGKIASKESAQNTEVNISKTEFDLGTLKKGSDTSFFVSIKNIGKSPFWIYDAQISCSCTSISYDKKPLSPGSTTKLKINYKADAVGTFHRTIYIVCNIRDTPILIIINGIVI